MNIQENVDRVRERMAAACARSGRQQDDVRLIAVSKMFPAEQIHAAYVAGLRDFGENRVQEAATKRLALQDLGITWHLIGHLQSNKATRALELFDWIHSVDSAGLAAKLDRAAATTGKRLPILLEVNLGGEASKSGVAEEEAASVAAALHKYSNLDLRGLMTIPPFFEYPEQTRPYFRRLRELAQKLRGPGAGNMTELSMGMSHDFEVAIEEGATMIRVGTAIFGARG
ncbi:MAG TPA: YggS family pyridoxal phosphate-dependent enzyme [Terriglobia bacterium]|nr:YggS family pyridoxal phosphate-dependent enzyme [Terriglobia bacterium]